MKARESGMGKWVIYFLQEKTEKTEGMEDIRGRAWRKRILCFLCSLLFKQKQKRSYRLQAGSCNGSIQSRCSLQLISLS